MTSTENKPDVAWFWVPYDTYKKIVEAGTMLEPLDDVYASEGWDKILSPATIKTYTSPDGKKYAVNTEIVWCQVMYTNDKIFKDLGLAKPKTYDELIADSAKIKAAGFIPMTVGVSTLGPQMWRSIVQSELTPEQYDKFLQWGTKSDFSYSSPEMVKAWDVIKQLGKNTLADGSSTMTDDQARALFVQGKSAIYASGSWAASDSVLFKELPKDFQLGYTFYPSARADVQPKVNVVDCNGLMVMKNTGREKLAKSFLAFVMSYDRQKALAASKQFVPSRTDMKQEDLKPLGDLTMAMYNQMQKDGVSGYWGLSTPLNVWDSTVKIEQQVIGGTMTPEDAAKAMGVEVSKLQK